MIQAHALLFPVDPEHTVQDVVKRSLATTQTATQDSQHQQAVTLVRDPTRNPHAQLPQAFLHAALHRISAHLAGTTQMLGEPCTVLGLEAPWLLLDNEIVMSQ